MDSRIAPYWTLITKEAEAHDLDPYLVAAIILVESGGKADAFNKKSKATGLCQIIPAEAQPTWGRPTIAQLKEPATNIYWGCAILAAFTKMENGDVKRGLYRYSGGKVWKSFADYEARYWSKVQAFKAELEGTGEMDGLAKILVRRLGERFVDYRGKLSDGFGPMDSTKARYLAVHHATGSRNVTIEAIHKHHTVTNGWSGVGYHFTIRLGTLYYVGDVNTMRAHVKGRNDEALGVCITGDYSKVLPAAEDVDVLRQLVAGLDEWFKVDKEITDHRTMLPGHTTCPGDAFHNWLRSNDLRAPTTPEFAIGQGIRDKMKELSDTAISPEFFGLAWGSRAYGKRFYYDWIQATGEIVVTERVA